MKSPDGQWSKFNICMMCSQEAVKKSPLDTNALCSRIVSNITIITLREEAAWLTIFLVQMTMQPYHSILSTTIWKTGTKYHHFLTLALNSSKRFQVYITKTPQRNTVCSTTISYSNEKHSDIKLPKINFHN